MIDAEGVLELVLDGAGRFNDDLGGGRSSRDEVVDDFVGAETAGADPLSESESDP